MADEFKNVPEHETSKVATDESSATTGEVKSRGLFDFFGKKEEVKPQETSLESEFEHKTQVSEPPAFVAKHEEEGEKENKPTLLEKLHQKHEEEEENKPGLLHKLHRSNSSSSSSSDEEGEDGVKRKKKKDKTKIVEGDEKTEEEKEGIMDKMKEKLPGHGTKPENDVPVVTTAPMVTAPHPMEHPVEHPVENTQEKKRIMDKIKEKLPGHGTKPANDVPVVTTAPMVAAQHPMEHPVEHPEEHTAEKKGILEKIKEKLPGYHAKTEEEKKEKESL